MQIHVLDISYEHGNRAETLHPVIIIEKDEMILVDCGYPGSLGLIIEAAAKQGIHLEHLTGLLLTHHDIDHMGSAADITRNFPRVKVYASLKEAPYISGVKKSLRLQQAEDLFPALPEQHQPGALLFMEALNRLVPVAVQETLLNNDVLLEGALQVVATPGHTPGHISIYLPHDRVLLAADALVVEDGALAIANPQFTLDLPEAWASVNKLAKLDLCKIICYHGGVVEHGIPKQLFALGADQ